MMRVARGIMLELKNALLSPMLGIAFLLTVALGWLQGGRGCIADRLFGFAAGAPYFFQDQMDLKTLFQFAVTPMALSIVIGKDAEDALRARYFTLHRYESVRRWWWVLNAKIVLVICVFVLIQFTAIIGLSYLSGDVMPGISAYLAEGVASALPSIDYTAPIALELYLRIVLPLCWIITLQTYVLIITEDTRMGNATFLLVLLISWFYPDARGAKYMVGNWMIIQRGFGMAGAYGSRLPMVVLSSLGMMIVLQIVIWITIPRKKWL